FLPAVESASSEQFENLAVFRREIVARGGLQLTKGGYHESHLRDMDLAGRASVEMCLEPVPLLRSQFAVQVGCHQLREFVARHLRRRLHLRLVLSPAPSKYGSSAARALDRARCRSTR